MAFADRISFKFGLVALLSVLAGCAGSLAHIETQKRMAATYAGFPPPFTDARLNEFRDRYLAEKTLFDENREGFLGLDSKIQSCPISPAEAEQLARTSFRLTIHERSPAWSDYMNKAGYGYVAEALDKARVQVLQGDCSDGTLNGPAQVLMSYMYILKEGQLDEFKVHEVTVRENCNYAEGQRNGYCARYTWERNWTGMMFNGRLMHIQRAKALALPKYVKPFVPGTEYYEYTTIFDYGQYRDGLETGPGVAFETTPPHDESKVRVTVNHTLVRTAMPDGRVAYDEFYGNHHKVRYILRNGVADGELVFSPGEADGADDLRLCFQNGVAVLSDQCTA
ncbi:MAG: hypothetical protein WBA88_19885 [Pseudaminobacter sp.]